jgi:hypothetical protein
MCWLHQSAELWHYPTFLLWPLLLVACVECFAGYHAWRFLLGLNGALLGFLAGLLICVWTGSPVLAVLGALAAAAAGAVLFATCLPLGTSVVAFGSAASFAILVGHALALPSALFLSLAGVAGIVVAVAVWKFGRPVLIAIAAAAGAQQIVAAWSACHLPADLIPVSNTLVPSEWAITAALAALGLLIQFATTPQRSPPPHIEGENNEHLLGKGTQCTDQGSNLGPAD